MRDYSERKKKKQKTINPHSYPTVVQRGGGGGMEPIPGVFDIFLILPLWVMALLEACDVTNNGRHLGF